MYPLPKVDESFPCFSYRRRGGHYYFGTHKVSIIHRAWRFFFPFHSPSDIPEYHRYSSTILCFQRVYPYVDNGSMPSEDFPQKVYRQPVSYTLREHTREDADTYNAYTRRKTYRVLFFQIFRRTRESKFVRENLHRRSYRAVFIFFLLGSSANVEMAERCLQKPITTDKEK